MVVCAQVGPVHWLVRLPRSLTLSPCPPTPCQILVFFPDASKVGVKEIKEMSEKMKVRRGGGRKATRWDGVHAA